MSRVWPTACSFSEHDAINVVDQHNVQMIKSSLYCDLYPVRQTWAKIPFITGCLRPHPNRDREEHFGSLVSTKTLYLTVLEIAGCSSSVYSYSEKWRWPRSKYVYTYCGLENSFLNWNWPSSIGIGLGLRIDSYLKMAVWQLTSSFWLCALELSKLYVEQYVW